MNTQHFNQILSERIGTFKYLRENALYPDVKEWADDCIDILEQVKKDFQMCQEEPESDEEELMRKFYVGAKCRYVGDKMPEFKKIIWTIVKADEKSVWVNFIKNMTLRFDKSEVMPF